MGDILKIFLGGKKESSNIVERLQSKLLEIAVFRTYNRDIKKIRRLEWEVT